MTIMKKRIAAVVVNDKGQILPFTVQATKEECEEHAKQKYGSTWGRIKSLGARVVQCEIVLLEE